MGLGSNTHQVPKLHLHLKTISLTLVAFSFINSILTHYGSYQFCMRLRGFRTAITDTVGVPNRQDKPFTTNISQTESLGEMRAEEGPSRAVNDPRQRQKIHTDGGLQTPANTLRRFHHSVLVMVIKATGNSSSEFHPPSDILFITTVKSKHAFFKIVGGGQLSYSF